MRHFISIGAKQYRNDSVRHFTHVLIGQRSEDHFRPDVPVERIQAGLRSMLPPPGEGEEPRGITDEEAAAVRIHAFRQTRGWFQVLPLDWYESEEAAEAGRASYAEPEWVNLRVVPVASTIDFNG